MSENTVTSDVGRPLLQVRHEAGLGAGRCLDLVAGRFDFGPNTGLSSEDGEEIPGDVTFTLDVSAPRVVLEPKSDQIWLDGQRITSPTELSTDQAIQVDKDLFIIVDRRARPRERIRLHPPRLQPPPSSRWRRRARKANERSRQRQLSRFGADLDQAALAERRRQRRGSGLRSEAEQAINRGRILKLRTPRSVAIGLTTTNAQFRPNDLIGPLPAELETLVEERASLVATPALVHLGHERIGIAGPPDATQAVCRHLLLSLAASSPGDRVDFDPSVVGSWAGLDDLLAGDNPMLTIADATSASSAQSSSISRYPESTIVLAETSDEIVGCDVELVVDADGNGMFRRKEEPAVPVLVMGASTVRTRALTERMAAATPPTAPQDFSHGAVMVSGSDRAANNVILASLALDLLGRPNNDGLHMFIVDRPDRALMRLKQLPNTSGYTAADDPEGLATLLHQLEQHTSSRTESTAILLVNELGPLMWFLHRLERNDLIDHLDRTLRGHDRVELLVAASGPDEAAVDPEVLQRFPSRVRCAHGLAHLWSESGEQAIELGDLAERDLTSVVADLQPR